MDTIRTPPTRNGHSSITVAATHRMTYTVATIRKSVQNQLARVVRLMVASDFRLSSQPARTKSVGNLVVVSLVLVPWVRPLGKAANLFFGPTRHRFDI